MALTLLRILGSKNGNIKNPLIKKRILQETTRDMINLGFKLTYDDANRKLRNLLITYRKINSSSNQEEQSWPYHEVS